MPLSPFAAVVLVAVSVAARQPVAAPVELHEALVVAPVGSAQRTVIAADPVALALVRGTWTAPKAGDPLAGDRKWAAAAIEDGKLACRGGGYAFVPFAAVDAGVLILQASGHGMVYVNGQPRAGDPYETGYCRVPIRVNQGENWLLFRTSRPELKIAIARPPAPVYLDTGDPTLPDLVRDESGVQLGAVVVVNATEEWVQDLAITASLPGGPTRRTPIPALPPVSLSKVGFEFEAGGLSAGDSMPLKVGLGRGEDVEFTLRVRSPDQTRKITFRSGIDGSVQYYAARVASGEGSERPGMIVTLHGAGVEAIGQADAYGPKAWAHLVAPTNRRPYGFDWEDWGRLDFLEVFAAAKARFAPDDSKIWLTGHSMGGHGTWQIGAQFPGLFGAIAPSAAWISMRSYAGAAAYDAGTPIEQTLRRAASPSDTLALKENYRAVGVYILHGDADDNVPVEQARTMRGELASFHSDFAYYERPGAGHWWGGECVDWPPLMAFLQQHPVPDRLSQGRTRFTTMSPGVSNSPSGWVSVEAQVEAFKPSTVDLRVDAKAGAFSGTTTNVARLALDLGTLKPKEGEARTVIVELDGQKLEGIPIEPGQRTLLLSRAHEGGAWAVGGPGPGPHKSPAAGGPFKDAFRNRVVLVVGTGGSADENALMLDRARFDAETFWYRGNGFLQIVTDRGFDDAAFAGRNVILYGNAQTNAAWSVLLPDSPVQVTRDSVTIGGKTVDGSDLACLFIRPRPGDDRACVGVVAGTGHAGLRLTASIPYFRSGTALPDWIVMGSDALEHGISGIRGAGFFDNDWGISAADTAWAEP